MGYWSFTTHGKGGNDMGNVIAKALVGLAIPIMVSIYFVTQKDVSSGTLLWACFWEVCVAGSLF